MICRFRFNFYFFISALKASLALSAIVLIPILSNAYDSFPEYWSLTESEQSSFDDPTLIDSESASDTLTYTKPLAWDRQFFSKALSYDLSVGSLSGVRFQIDSRLQLSKSSPPWRFQLIDFSHRDTDDDLVKQVIEVQYQLHPRFWLASYGYASLYKRENDLGFALLFEPRPQETLRFFVTAVDFTRASHNDRQDYFRKGHEPFVLGFTYRQTRAESFSRAHVRWESPTEWVFPDSNIDYNYERQVVGLDHLQSWDNQTQISFRSQWDRKREANRSTSTASSSLVRSVQRDRLQMQMDVESYLEQSRWQAGTQILWRQWQMAPRGNSESATMSPFFWWKQWMTPKTQQERFAMTDASHEVHWGYEFSIFKNGSGFTDEHRFNARWLWLLISPDSPLQLTLTWDLDELARRQGGYFEGGQAQFQTSF